jgi:hypothetical protein
VHSQYVHPKHPPGKEYRDDGPRDVNYPVASCFRFPKIEHAAMVARPRAGGVTSLLHSLPCCERNHLIYNRRLWFQTHSSPGPISPVLAELTGLFLG